MIKLPEPAVHGLHAYTESQMRQVIKDALEEAANACQQVSLSGDVYDIKYECVTAIRKLKEQVDG